MINVLHDVFRTGMRRRAVPYFVAVLTVFPFGAFCGVPASEEGAAGPRVLVCEIEGRRVSGVLVRFDSETVTLADGPETEHVLPGRILEIVHEMPGTDASGPDDSAAQNNETHSPVESPENLPLVLTFSDGSRMVASDVRWDGGDSVTIVLPDASRRSFATELAVNIRFSVPGDAAGGEPQKELQELLREHSVEDRLIVGEDGAYDYYAGMVRGLTPTSVLFELDGEILRVNRAKIAAVAFRTAPRKSRKENEFCTFREKNGSLWCVAELTFDREKNEFQWRTVSGIAGRTSGNDWRSIGFAGKNIRSLFDLTPEALSYSPRWTWEHARERHPADSLRKWTLSKTGSSAVPGAPESHVISQESKTRPVSSDREREDIRIDGRKYVSGYTLAARTEMTFSLDGEYGRLRGLAGIDDRIRPYGNVTLVIRGDETVLLEETIRGDRGGRPIDLDLTGVRKLTFLAEFSDAIAPGACVTLVDMVLLK